MTYWDASMLVPLVRQEASTADAQALYAASGENFTLTTTETELECAISRPVFEGRIAPATAASFQAAIQSFLSRLNQSS